MFFVYRCRRSSSLSLFSWQLKDVNAKKRPPRKSRDKPGKPGNKLRQFWTKLRKKLTTRGRKLQPSEDSWPRNSSTDEIMIQQSVLLVSLCSFNCFLIPFFTFQCVSPLCQCMLRSDDHYLMMSSFLCHIPFTLSIPVTNIPSLLCFALNTCLFCFVHSYQCFSYLFTVGGPQHNG